MIDSTSIGQAINSPQLNRVSRFAFGGTTVAELSAEIVIDGIRSPRGTTTSASGDRRNDTGRAANRNGPCQEVFARGPRNSFRIAAGPAADLFFISDVGAGAWDEVYVAQAGAERGWNKREGPRPVGETRRRGERPPGTTDPFHAYQLAPGCRSTTGGAFVPDGGGWPPALGGASIDADSVCARCFPLEPGGRDWRASGFLRAVGQPDHLGSGPAADGNSQDLCTASFRGAGPNSSEPLHRVVIDHLRRRRGVGGRLL